MTLAAAIALAPALVPVLALAGLLRRRRFALLRTYFFIGWLLVAESAGVVAATLFWCRATLQRPSPEVYARWHYRLQQRWTGAMWNGARAAFGFRLELEVTPEAAAAIERGPVVLLSRHAGVADVLLPALVVANPFNVCLRYVLKRELLTDPCLDLVGQRLPNAFVGREGSDSERAVTAIVGLAKGIGRGDGVLIYPEGTRFTAAKRDRIIRSAIERGDAELADYAESLTATLPPRPKGTLALLNAAPTAGLLVLEHTGFERATRLPDLASGSLVGLVVRARLRLTPTLAKPDLADLRRIWSEVDDWVVANSLPPRGGVEESS
ncbi:MAG: 1-acyl-sn-glycerol-3-phosphate acyltransferase [Bradymonadia bacterium]